LPGWHDAAGGEHGVVGAVSLPPVQDQGELNSCTAHVLAAAVQHVRPADPAPSRLFIYYNERANEGTLGRDPHGRPVQMRDGLRAVGDGDVRGFPAFKHRVAVLL
jgi:hypothetical protein